MASRLVIASDFSVFGDLNSEGLLRELSTEETIENAFRMWLVSSRGENIRRPAKGGYLKEWIAKPMTPENLDRIEMAIRNGVEQDFTPYIVIQELRLTPDYGNRTLEISLKGYSPDYKTQLTSITTLRTG